MEVSVIEGECCWLRLVQSQRCILKSFGVHSYMTRDLDFSILDLRLCWILALFILPSVVPFWSWLKYSASFINLYFYCLAPLVVSLPFGPSSGSGRPLGLFGPWSRGQVWRILWFMVGKAGWKTIFLLPKMTGVSFTEGWDISFGDELHPNSNPEYLKLNDIFDWEGWEMQIQIEMAERLSKLKL